MCKKRMRRVLSIVSTFVEFVRLHPPIGRGSKGRVTKKTGSRTRNMEAKFTELQLRIADCRIEEVLTDAGVWDLLQDRDGAFYVGGSLPTYCLSGCGKGCPESPHDIDVYTGNQFGCVRALRRFMDKIIVQAVRGCIVDFVVAGAKVPMRVQIITAPVNRFAEDVLDRYDCSLVAVGYNPRESSTRRFVVTEPFLHGLREGAFPCASEVTPERVAKVQARATAWYGAKVVVGQRPIPRPEYASFLAHYTATATDESPAHGLKRLQEVAVPEYVHMFHDLRRCTCCRAVGPTLLCVDCERTVRGRWPVRHPVPKEGWRAVVLGGLHGFGFHVTSALRQRYGDAAVLATSREVPQGTTGVARFVLGLALEGALKEALGRADLIVLNAAKTLDGNDAAWQTTASSFDAALLMDRLRTNVVGYARFLGEYMDMRRGCVGASARTTRMVFVDANESKFAGKMFDGRHPEVNVAKAGCKQLIYTYAPALWKLGVRVACYDPGWMSEHATSLADEPHSKEMPADISARGIVAMTEEDMQRDEDDVAERSVYSYVGHRP